jgi:seryl-tRNA synthetase
MLDIQFIRDNPNIVKKACMDKLITADIDSLLELDTKIKEVTFQVDNFRAERNSLSKEIPGLTGEEKNQSVLKVKEIKSLLGDLEKKQEDLRLEFEKIMFTIPSIPAPEVPVGKGEGDNVEIKKWGEIPIFDFEPKDHLELAEILDIVEIPRAVKFAGSRSYFLKNEGVLLEMALTRFVVEKLFNKGYVPLTPPVLVKENAMLGTGYFPAGVEQSYKITEDELYLVGTSEVPLVSFHQNETLTLEELPKKYVGISPCFRREAGTYGKDTRGLYRVHQFQKVEQVILCENDDEIAKKLHFEILKNVEEIMQALELPYRIALACTGEIGIGQVRKHEVETWMPSRKSYSETHSCSTLNDFQSRRSNIKYRDSNGNLKFAFTLNNTAIASPRILIPILETYQNADGSVRVPKVLIPYMGGIDLIKPKKAL